MEKIVLTQKDADFILAYIRSDLARLTRRCDEANAKEAKLEEIAKEVGDNPFVNALTEIVKKSSEEFHSLYKKQTDIAIKCIELLTVGSAND
jgi:hypothetical protein